jgi:hypothetical protein
VAQLAHGKLAGNTSCHKGCSSHVCGVAQAWLRARGENGPQTIDSEDIIEKYGVVKGSYDAVPLPRVNAYTVGVWSSGITKNAFKFSHPSLVIQYN